MESAASDALEDFLVAAGSLRVSMIANLPPL
jgi:hypothetical protein